MAPKDTEEAERERFKDQFKHRLNKYLNQKKLTASGLEIKAGIGGKNLYNSSVGNSLPRVETLYKLKRWDSNINLNYLVADSGPMIIEGKEYPSPPELILLAEEANEYKTKYIRSFETLQDLREENERQRLKILRLEEEVAKLTKKKAKARKQ